MSLLSTRDDTARGLSSEPRSGRGERQDFVASAVVLDKVCQLCLDKFNVSLGGGLDRSRALFRIGHLRQNALPKLTAGAQVADI